MPGQLRQGQHEPITPSRGGAPPGWVVACLDCGFCADASGLIAEDAIQAVAPHHERAHRLIAWAIDYTVPTFGKDGNAPHPLYCH